VCLITLDDYSGINIFLAVLTLSILGTLKKLFLTGKFEIISLLLYLAMGWLIVLDINSLFDLISSDAKLLLISGGISYTFGIIFYVMDKIKYFHSIWHLFVLTGSILHYFMILFYII
jgi:hemolysin III